ncbi:MAG: bifunctional proline dehydrogenase/L-glutamate gamma-semialdehyde dehydrogenase PutA, partial [Pseudomonadota bacterium]
SVAAILAMQAASGRYEFQRLHGMGEALHETVRETHGTRCRIYAPVGAHEDLLAYLVRRLLENGANSSFVNQIVDEDIAPDVIARDPLDEVPRAADGTWKATPHPMIRKPADLFSPRRSNASGYDVNEPASIVALIDARGRWADHVWSCDPLGSDASGELPTDGSVICNPARPGDGVGLVRDVTRGDCAAAVKRAKSAQAAWAQVPAAERAARLRTAAALYEAQTSEFCALASREAGKTLTDGIAEVREAVDFLRYYAAEIERLAGERVTDPRGTIVCISPWNFPLAIFTGQIAAALAAGNTVIAKPAEEAPLIAARAIQLLHEARIPTDVLQLLPGTGETVGAALTSDPSIAGVCFTGSTEVARHINLALAEHAPRDAMLIAETGGLNAMIVDSTALPEQAVGDIIVSAFQSAGQRCSALRMLYVQEDVADKIKTMLFGAMDELVIGDPWDLATDIGPVITADAAADIQGYCDAAREGGRLIKQCAVPTDATGQFVGPAVIAVDGIADIPREVFGPVLHVATFKADEIDAVVDAINARGYGLTFGLHTRIDDRIDQIVSRVACGNAYVNRNQIGAIVGSQPFGGEGLSGTGPKAGGPYYVPRFLKRPVGPRYRRAPSGQPPASTATSLRWPELPDTAAPSDEKIRAIGAAVSHAAGDAAATAVAALASAARVVHDLPGPTGESNVLSTAAKDRIVVVGRSPDDVAVRAAAALVVGSRVIALCPDAKTVEEHLGHLGLPLTTAVLDEGLQSVVALGDIDCVLSDEDRELHDWLCIGLARRPGPIVPLVMGWPLLTDLVHERHLCVDTTAAGGNAALLASAESAP